HICVESFFFQCSGDTRDLHSFPTRRSSDLWCGPSNWRARPVELTSIRARERLQPRATHRLSEQTKFKVQSSKFKVRPRFAWRRRDRKSTRLNSGHDQISYAVFCLKKKKNKK